MAELFQRDKSTISRHIKNIFEEGEYISDSVVANFATTAKDGKTYQVEYYNLDVIISVGYRVKSLRGTQFRIWAMQILKEYMQKGFALDDNRLKELGAETILMNCLSEFVIFVRAKKSFGEKCLIFMLRVLIIIRVQKAQLHFLSKYRIKCIGRFTNTPLRE